MQAEENAAQPKPARAPALDDLADVVLTDVATPLDTTAASIFSEEVQAAESTAELLGLVPFDRHAKESKKEAGGSGGDEASTSVPVYVMLPLNAVKPDGTLNNPEGLRAAFHALSGIGVKGVMVDVWWGVVEREGPRQYDWAAYQELLLLAKLYGLRIQAVMSFHACGNNVGDDVDIKLPAWVRECAEANPHLLYRDQHGYHNPECLSLWADNVPDLHGRTPLDCYSDFMQSFKDAMGPDVGDTINDICVGCGPCGELRYPAYPENRRSKEGSQWRFPGIGEFQCYDRYSLANLRDCAEECGQPEWGQQGPHDAGAYNDWPEATGFFRSEGGSWDSEYGHFFLDWYSRSLTAHGERMVSRAASIFNETSAGVSVKLAGVHWWYNSRSHAAELTAGYYNVRQGYTSPNHNGYESLCRLFAKYNARLNFTCVEMKDEEHPYHALCSPEGLLRQVRLTAAKYGVAMSGENALCRFDAAAHNQIVENARGALLESGDSLQPLKEFTFLRLFPEFFDERNFRPFLELVNRMTGEVCDSDSTDSSLQNYEDALEYTGNIITRKDGGTDGDGYLIFKF